ncbi:MAG TPA: DEAD/DEAH box helicase [Terracidiphilus sp.]|jgi:superfamily II DNA or RNA helicase/predicted nucleic acid-binding Zn finger protein|nr:DEAD/DEAH box helicase [Terracidiphilus sp.]
MLIEQQIAERRDRAAAAPLKILKRPAIGPYGDYTVKSASGRTYRVALRGLGLFENYCSCPDFAINTLGTCKHVEAILLRLRKRHQKSLEAAKFKRARASISLQYGESIEVRLRLPASPSPGLQAVAAEHFDAAGLLRREHYRQFSEVLESLRNADGEAVVYSDALEYIDRENELGEGLELERKLLAKLKRGQDPTSGLLKTKLLPYQARGAVFAACRGRAVLADDMGLGKTVQALAMTELLRRRRGIERVLVIAPASVKYQWKTEIEKFTSNSAQVIDGMLPRRRTMYASPAFFNLTSYELVLKDIRYMQELSPDLIVLDEAQRIRNWTTATARTIKQLKSRYALVLTGTPLENKLEELFSVVEFVDGRRLGPAFRFLDEHRVVDEKGHLTGYRGLDRIHEQLAPILLRRTRPEVLKELPERTDKVFRVPLTSQQAEPYYEQSDILAALMRKWERQGWLSEIDQKRILCCIQNMRMLCNSTFLFDKQTHHSPKLQEFREIITDVVVEEDRKAVVFSEFERMTHLAGEELRKLGIEFVSLHGGVPSRQRGALIERFRNDPACKVFLSTDAGGVGLNLQAASVVVNFEPPWNPARLEQRIGRVHRLGQSRPVHVIHMLTEKSIEERVWETLALKKSLFAGVFDSPTDEVSFAKLGRKTVLQAVKEIFAEQPERPKPVIDHAPPVPVAVMQPQFDGQAEQPGVAGAIVSQPAAAPPIAAHAPNGNGIEHATASFIDAGLKLIESIAANAAGGAAGAPANRLNQALAALFTRDARTNRPALTIPLPESVTQERLSGAISTLLSAFGPTA